MTRGNTNWVEIHDPWSLGGTESCSRWGWLHVLSVCLVPWGWPRKECEVLPEQLQHLELAMQDQSYVIFSHIFLTHIWKYEEIVFFRRIFCISITCFIQHLKRLYIESLSAIPVTLMLMEKLVTEPRKYTQETWPLALFLNLQITFSLETNKWP